MYRKPIEKASTESKIAYRLTEPFSSYFGNFMYRPIMHGGKHSEERVMSMVIDDQNNLALWKTEIKGLLLLDDEK